MICAITCLVTHETSFTAWATWSVRHILLILVFHNKLLSTKRKSGVQKTTVNWQERLGLALCMKYLWLVDSVMLGKRAAVSMRQSQRISVT